MMILTLRHMQWHIEMCYNYYHIMDLVWTTDFAVQSLP